MTRKELVTLLETVTYKPGYDLRVKLGKGGTVLFGISVLATDSQQPDKKITVASQWALDPSTINTKGEALWLVLEMIKSFETHEMYEWFKVSKVQYERPHP